MDHNRKHNSTALLCCLISFMFIASCHGQPEQNQTMSCTNFLLKFDFGDGQLLKGFTKIGKDTMYSPETGYGFMESADISTAIVNNKGTLKTDCCTSDIPFLFTADVPEEGNYKVTVVLGNTVKSKVYVKAESRRLMLENVQVEANSTVSKTFIVNIRNSVISEGKSVRLKKREIGALHWDNSLTLEFNGQNPGVCAIEIEKINDVPTIFLTGDSTVTDQQKEPWTSWGQMLTNFFKPEIAVANYAESGETLRAFKGERRLEKIGTQITSGDYMFIQFAHNDMKRGTVEEIGYKQSIIEFMEIARKHGAHPVLVTSMHRRSFDENEKVVDTMKGFPQAMIELAKEQNVPVIDLNSMSRKFYEALGPDESAKAFVDGTHHNAYGAYELAKCIIEGIKTQVPELTKYVKDDMIAKTFDPANPDNVDKFNVPASPMKTDVKPEGS